MERRHAARRPPETLFRVPQIAHDVSVFPAALLCARSAQISRRRRTVVHSAQPVGQKCCYSFHSFTGNDVDDGHWKRSHRPPLPPVKVSDPFRYVWCRPVFRIRRYIQNRRLFTRNVWTDKCISRNNDLEHETTCIDRSNTEHFLVTLAN